MQTDSLSKNFLIYLKSNLKNFPTTFNRRIFFLFRETSMVYETKPPSIIGFLNCAIPYFHIYNWNTNTLNHYWPNRRRILVVWEVAPQSKPDPLRSVQGSYTQLDLLNLRRRDLHYGIITYIGVYCASCCAVELPIKKQCKSSANNNMVYS